MTSRPVLVLLVGGLLLLPGPVYAGVVDSMTPDRVPNGYSAEQVDLDDADTRERVVDTFEGDVTISLNHVAEPYLADRFRAQNRTVEVLERAYRHSGPVRVTDADTQADVAKLARNASFLRTDFDHDPRRLVVERRESALVVSTHETNSSALFRAVRAHAVVHYDALSPAERATVDRVLNTSDAEHGYYRPYENEPHPFPALVERDGDYYLVRSTIVVDEFGPDGLFIGLLATGLGLVSILGGGALAFLGRFGGRW